MRALLVPTGRDEGKRVLAFREQFRFTDQEGGAGGTPLHQCLLKKTPAALLAARFIVARFPDLVVDPYGHGKFRGEHLLHMCIVVQARAVTNEQRTPQNANRPVPVTATPLPSLTGATAPRFPSGA